MSPGVGDVLDRGEPPAECGGVLTALADGGRDGRCPHLAPARIVPVGLPGHLVHGEEAEVPDRDLHRDRRGDLPGPLRLANSLVVHVFVARRRRPGRPSQRAAERVRAQRHAAEPGQVAGQPVQGRRGRSHRHDPRSHGCAEHPGDDSAVGRHRQPCPRPALTPAHGYAPYGLTAGPAGRVGAATPAVGKVRCTSRALARNPMRVLLVHDYRSGLGFLLIQQVRFLALAGKEQGRDDGRPDEREGHPVGVGERVRGLG